MDEMHITRVGLQAPREATDDLRSFYLERLGFDPIDDPGGDALAFAAGDASASFVASESAAFYHFAFLVPGDRFDAAYEWLRARTTLLADPDTHDEVFDFVGWDALACYCLDPAGNVVELIAHSEVAESRSEGDFSAREISGFSEIGLVVEDKEACVTRLENELGLRVWDGNRSKPGRLVFVGERARTLILAPPGRGWLPTARPAEIHPVDLVVAGAGIGEAWVPPHRVTGVG